MGSMPCCVNIDRGLDARSGQDRRSLVRCSIRTSQKIFGSMLNQDKSEDLWFDARSGQVRRSLVQCSIRTSQKIFGSMSVLVNTKTIINIFVSLLIAALKSKT